MYLEVIMKKSLIVLFLIILFLLLIMVNYLHLHDKENINTDLYSNSELYKIKYFNPIHSDYYYGNDFSFFNNIYYKIIKNYEEYLTYKNYYQEIIDMSEEDFNTNFIILSITENESTKNLSFENLDTSDSTLYIGLNKNLDTPQRGISIKIDNSLLREKTDIYQTIKDVNFITTYKDIKSIPKEYTIQEAINDNCFIILSDSQITYNEHIFDTFIKNINNNENAEIRIFNQSSINNITNIFDIKYSSQNNKYYVCKDTSRNLETNESYNYFEYDKFEKKAFNKVDLINSEQIENYMFCSNNFPETNCSILFYTNK